jgi:cytochrome c oxidase subunit 2
MHQWNSALRRHLGWAPLCALLAATLTACADPAFTQNTLNPRGDFARMVDHVFRTTVWWAALVFVLVEGALLYAIFRFRGRPDDPEPKQIHGNTTVEIAWTIIPALILAMIAVPTVRAIFRSYDLPNGPGVTQVEVIGHQWWWEFRYPKEGVVTAGELHVPVNKPIALRMTTQDVLHAFWVPQFAGKRDVFPNRNNVLWFTAEVTGNFSGQCAEFCGIEHGRMGYRLVVESQEDFDKYIKGLQATAPPGSATMRMVSSAGPDAAAAPAGAVQVSTSGATVPPQKAKGDTAAAAVTAAPAADTAAPADPLVAQGEKLFTAKGCIGCHSLDATKPTGIGPNLANIGSRTYIAAGLLPNTDENLARWISNAQAVKPGVLMPNLMLKPDEAKGLVAYLRTHK